MQWGQARMRQTNIDFHRSTTPLPRLGQRLAIWSTLAAGLAVGIPRAESPTWAQGPATTAPAANAPNEQVGIEQLRVVIVAVQGMVQVRTAEDQAWQKAEVGMELGTGAEFRTGPRSSVSFKIPPDQTISLDRLGTIKVLQAIRASGKFKTDVGMRYGRTRYDIEAAGTEHEATIHSPAAILAVRGTSFGQYDQLPYPPQSYTLDNPVIHRRRTPAGSPGDSPPEVVLGDTGNPTTLTGDNTNPGLEAFFGSFVDPSVSRARTGPEPFLLTNIPILSGPNVDGSIGGGAFRGADVVSASPVSTITPTPDGFLRGQLTFDLRWSVDVDLDLRIVTPRNEILGTFPSPGSSLSVPSGGKIGRDDTGSSTGGREVATWSTFHPTGTYQFSANLSSGTLPANFTLQVRQQLEGQSQSTLTTLTGTLIPATQPSASGTITVGGSDPSPRTRKRK